MSGPRPALRVLLVDDHPLVRTGIRSSLRHHFVNLQVTEAGSAAEALAQVAASRPQLVLLDVNLPDTNGLDLLRQIRAQDKRARILMVAAEADPWSVNEALRNGALGFVAKTNSGDALPEAIRSVLAGRVYLCPDSRLALRRAEERNDTVAEAPGPAALSRREREIVCLLARGENTKSVAATLRVSPKTVETFRARAMRKLGTDNIAGLTRYAIRHGLVIA